MSEIKGYPIKSPEFELQTAVMESLVPAMHGGLDNWRSRADVLIDQLTKRGYEIVLQQARLRP